VSLSCVGTLAVSLTLAADAAPPLPNWETSEAQRAGWLGGEGQPQPTSKTLTDTHARSKAPALTSLVRNLPDTWSRKFLLPFEGATCEHGLDSVHSAVTRTGSITLRPPARSDDAPNHRRQFPEVGAIHAAWRSWPWCCPRMQPETASGELDGSAGCPKPVDLTPYSQRASDRHWIPEHQHNAEGERHDSASNCAHCG
jgi:hypothetical protein